MNFILKRFRGDRGNSQERQNRGLSLEIREKCDADAISANILATKNLSDFDKSPRGTPSNGSLDEKLSDVQRADWSDSIESMQMRHHRCKKEGDLAMIKQYLPGK